MLTYPLRREEIYKKFETVVKLPQHELQYIERGATPYCRPPYSFVADGFLVCGDVACLTKHSAGEGVTSSMVQLEIAVQVISELLTQEKYLNRENLWAINKRYVDAQGKAFASQMATLVGAVATNAKRTISSSSNGSVVVPWRMQFDSVKKIVFQCS